MKLPHMHMLTLNKQCEQAVICRLVQGEIYSSLAMKQAESHQKMNCNII